MSNIFCLRGKHGIAARLTSNREYCGALGRLDIANAYDARDAVLFLLVFELCIHAAHSPKEFCLAPRLQYKSIDALLLFNCIAANLVKHLQAFIEASWYVCHAILVQEVLELEKNKLLTVMLNRDAWCIFL